MNPAFARRLYLGPGETAKVTLVPLEDKNEIVNEQQNVLLKANAAGKYRGWVNKDLKQASATPTAYSIIKLTDSDGVNEENQNWAKTNRIMNQPYFLEENENVDIKADKSFFAKSEYFPSPDDKVYKSNIRILRNNNSNKNQVHLNTNIANGPSIQGIKFKKPSVPFSTLGSLPDEDKCKNCNTKKCHCTHMGRFWNQ